jgi:hypothetical protein
MQTGVGVEWTGACLHCSCHGKDACDSELGGLNLKNMLRRHLLTENIDSAASVRINNFKDIKTSLISLGADFPNNGEFVPGGDIQKDIL